MIVEVNNLQKSFGGKKVLDGLHLSIPEASVYGLVGKNGAGKTTLLNILAGVSEATAGECLITGERICKGGYGSGVVGYLPDLPNFFDYLTVDEYIRFILSASMARKDALTRTVEKKVAELELNGKARVKSLSRGNKQKLGILAAVITEPKVLILDEPTSALDPVGRREVMSLIRDLRDQGMTILFSTHILSDLELVCDRIGFLHKGIIQKEICMDSGDEQEAYELVLRSGTEQDYTEITRTLPAYQVESLDGGNRLVCRPINGLMDQAEFFSAISKAGADILSVKKVSRKDLDAIMVEVLSQ